MALIDLSHVFQAEMPVFPGDPPSRLEDIATVATDGYAARIHHGGLHVGTHIDAPAHMLATGRVVADLPLARCFGRGRLVDARGRKRITADLLDSVPLSCGDLVLVLTGHDALFRTPAYDQDYPLVTPDFATRRVDAGVSALGLDTPSPDVTPFPVHRFLLARDVVLIENMTNLAALLDVDAFNVAAFPLRLCAEASWVRAVAMVG